MMGRRLLVAEKDVPLRQVLQRALEDRGYEVETAADEVECLEKLHTARPDVLLLDRQLSPSGGDGVVDRLRHDRDVRRIPIVLLVGMGSPGALARLVVSPVIACLQKPFRFSTLLEVLSTAADEKTYRWPVQEEKALIGNLPLPRGHAASLRGAGRSPRALRPAAARPALAGSAMP